MPQAKNQKKIQIYALLSVSISIIIIILLLVFTFDAQTLEYLSKTSIRYEYFIAAVLINIMTWFIWGARVKIISNAIDPKLHIKWWESTKIVIANFFLAGITPSVAGGEPVRIYLLKKNGMTLGGATASVLGERLFDAIFILLGVPIALFILNERIDINLIKNGVIIGIIVFIVCIALFVYAIIRPQRIKSFLIFIEGKIQRLRKKHDPTQHSRIIETISKEVDHFHESMRFFITQDKAALVLGGLVTAVYWLTAFSMASLILLALGLQPFLLESYAAQMLLIIIVMLPTTPGSSGVTELGVAGLYSVIISSSLLGVFVVIFRLITFYINLIAGAIFQLQIFKSITSLSFDMLQRHSSDTSNHQIKQEK